MLPRSMAIRTINCTRKDVGEKKDDNVRFSGGQKRSLAGACQKSNWGAQPQVGLGPRQGDARFCLATRPRRPCICPMGNFIRCLTYHGSKVSSSSQLKFLQSTTYLPTYLPTNPR